MVKIFSIDDSRAIRQLALTMTSMGHEVIRAADGIEAMTIARSHKFDIVLSNINMPGMNGISLISKLRKLK